MKHRKELEATNDSRTYGLILREVHLRCPFCPPNEGDNAGSSGRRVKRSWKKFRKTKWKAPT